MTIPVEYLFQCMIKVVARYRSALNKLIQIQQVRIIVEIVVFHWHFSSHRPPVSNAQKKNEHFESI